jgi:uncharacterized protein
LRALGSTPRHCAETLLVEQHPDYLLDPAPFMQAATHDLLEVAALLLDLGMSPDVQDAKNHRPLHTAAGSGSARVAALLIERGAEIDPRETRHNGIPLSWALHAQKRQTLDLLGRLSRDMRTLVRMGNIERLRELFARESSARQIRGRPWRPAFLAAGG